MFPKRTLFKFAAFFIIFTLTKALINIYPDLLWFQSFGFQEIWWFVLKKKLLFWAGFSTITFTLLSLNLLISNRISNSSKQSIGPIQFGPQFEFMNELFRSYAQFKAVNPIARTSKKIYFGIILSAIAAASIFLGKIGSSSWESILLALQNTSFGTTDPIFSKDLGFYILQLPVINHIQNWIGFILLITMGLVCWIYFSQNLLAALLSKHHKGGIKSHILILLGLFVLNWAFGIYLSQYDLLYSASGSVFGAGYTELHSKLSAIRGLYIGLIIEAIFIFILAFRSQFRLPIIGAAAILVYWVIAGIMIPVFMQNYIVTPNELKKETPYIKNSIKYTRLAYNLNNIKEVNITNTQPLTPALIKKNQTTLDNIRLWNPTPLIQTFKQLQEIRLYYEFKNIDVDRYVVDGKIQQVMLSARELDTTQLSPQAQTWINQHLVYTHGYGLCLSPVNKISPEGLPEFLVKDLPPTSKLSTQITRPEIYFGEQTTNTVFTNTNTEEFDYPKGSSNQMTHYKGSGGIELSSYIRKALYAFKLSDIKVLISNEITNKSRILIDRDITTITQKLFPFIAFDQDPYLVINDEGRLIWMVDGYVLSKKFPYSEPFKNQFNYIRNSVVVTIDAYNGNTNAYIKDNKDPIIAAYKSLYPSILHSLDKLPTSLLSHIRYPKTLFEIQSSMYSTYHMSDPQVFYNREDLWAIPYETYGESETKMAPYYTIAKSPGKTKESFILMRPFTPTNKNNMISWLSAESDPEHYGELTIYKFPKETTIFGPMQIESRIDQDTEISQKLTLWGQVGSRVIRGNLMIVPMDNTLIYAEPIYLQATQSKLPELKRVILAHQDNIIMTETLDDGISQLLDNRSHKQRKPKTLIQSSKDNLNDLINELKATKQRTNQIIDRLIKKLNTQSNK